jgi:hypothetical protein
MKRFAWACVLLMLAAAGVALIAGCETDSASNPITVQPNNIILHPGQSQVFTASGGYDYQWTLSQPFAGALSSKLGPQVVYVAYPGTEGLQQTITVQGFIQGRGQLVPITGDTNAAPRFNNVDFATTQAYVLQSSTGGSSTNH